MRKLTKSYAVQTIIYVEANNDEEAEIIVVGIISRTELDFEISEVTEIGA